MSLAGVDSGPLRRRVPAGSAPFDRKLGAAPEAQFEYAKLHLLRGAAFDHEFGRDMVKDHQNDIADFEKEAKDGDPSDPRALAKRSLPVLRKLLATASSIG